MTKHNILYMTNLGKIPKTSQSGGHLNLGDLKPFKSIMGGVLMNLVNYGGITNDIDYQDVE